jgi:hypothetical protein
MKESGGGGELKYDIFEKNSPELFVQSTLINQKKIETSNYDCLIFITHQTSWIPSIR